ncbi:hypothetical protein FPV67DRAFT_1656132 [Lyophyllum atratum]|nr:hypothetical protein FPV67DRAFT_1656132 [Lyophyllum atratum]
MDPSHGSHSPNTTPTILPHGHPSFPLHIKHEPISLLLTKMLIKSTSSALLATLTFLLLIGLLWTLLLLTNFHAAEFAEALMSSKTPGLIFRRYILPTTAGLLLTLALLSTQWEDSLGEVLLRTLEYWRVLGVYTVLFMLWMAYRTKRIVRRNAGDMELAGDGPKEKASLLPEDAKPEMLFNHLVNAIYRGVPPQSRTQPYLQEGGSPEEGVESRQSSYKFTTGTEGTHNITWNIYHAFRALDGVSHDKDRRRNAGDTESAGDGRAEKGSLLAEDAKPEIYLTGEVAFG